MLVETLRKASEDPEIEGLDCISQENLPKLIEVLAELPDDGCISEWRYGWGEIEYKCRIHKNGVVNLLQEAFEKGVRGGGSQKLTGVYSKQRLRETIQEFEAGSEY